MSEAIKSHPALLQVFAQRLKLEKRNDAYWSKCPFHSESSPGNSFNIGHDKKGDWVYNCFSCGSSGDAVKFIQEIDKVSFTEAKKILEGVTGGDWEETKQAADAVFKNLELAEESKSDRVPLEKYAKFELGLYQSPEAQEWLFRERGITYPAARQCRFGFCQTLDEVTKRYDKEKLKDIADKGWITFAAIEGDEVLCIEARSIVTKETRVRTGMTNKVLFGQEFVSTEEPLYLVEGKFDQAVMVQAGYRAISLPNASANLTPAMRDLLMSAPVLILAGDNDGASGTAKMLKMWNEFQAHTYLLTWDKKKDANQVFLETAGRDISIFRSIVDNLTLAAYSNPMPGVKSIQDILKRDESGTSEDNPNRFRFGWESVDKMANILPGSVVYVSATQTSTGKALANGSAVFTKEGKTTIESLRKGDEVFGVNGELTEVLGVFPQGLRDCFKVSFTDGTEVVCDEDHLWTVSTINNWSKKKFSTFTTKYLKENNANWSNGHKWMIPENDPVQFPKKNIPIDPYIMGVLIGDGCLLNTSLEFTSEDSFIVDEVSSRLPKGYKLTQLVEKTRRNKYYLVKENGNDGKPNQITRSIRRLGLHGKKSELKFIPEIYKFSSVEDRLLLLQGLMDTDGTADPRERSAEFGTSSKNLAEDVMFLVRSLGGFSSVCFKEKTHYKNSAGEKVECLPCWRVRVSMKNFSPFLLPRKVERYSEKGRGRIRRISSIESVGEHEATCIKVSAKDGLFLTNDFIVTHNSTWLIQASLNAARKNEEVVLNYQCEMSDSEIGEIVTANLLAKNRNDIKKEDRVEAAKRLKGVSYYVGNDPNQNSSEGVLDLIEAGVRRIGATSVILDHIHFLCRNSSNEIQEQSRAMQRIKRMSQKYGLKFFVVGQPRKPGQKTQGKAIDIYDAKGSESIVSDSDVVFFLHREVVKNMTEETKDNLSPEVQVRCMKGRSRGKGAAFTKLFFLGSLGTFNEIVNIEPPMVQQDLF